MKHSIFAHPHAICALLMALAISSCVGNHEPAQPLQASAVTADTIINLNHTSWQVAAINRIEGNYSCDISTDGTMACFADGEVAFAVPYTSISFDGDNESAIEYEQYGPYSVNYLTANTLTIANEAFAVVKTSNGYILQSTNLSIILSL